MTVKERLHRLINLLAGDEAKTAAGVLEALYPTVGLPALLRNAPPDDSPYTEEERVAAAEAWENVCTGRMEAYR